MKNYLKEPRTKFPTDFEKYIDIYIYIYNASYISLKKEDYPSKCIDIRMHQGIDSSPTKKKIVFEWLTNYITFGSSKGYMTVRKDISTILIIVSLEELFKKSKNQVSNRLWEMVYTVRE